MVYLTATAPYTLGRTQPIVRFVYPPVSPLQSNNSGWYRNINLFAIAYASRLGLGPDLPWEDDPCPGNLRFSAGMILTCLLATYTGILTCVRSTAPYDTASLLNATLPYQLR